MSEQPTSKKISGPFDFTLAQIQEMIDTSPACQCRGHVNASVYGWVSGTKSVWVLEAPTDEQYKRLNAFPRAENDEVLNEHLRDVGAVFYADYNDNEGAKMLMNLTTRSSHPNKGNGEREGGQGVEGMPIDGGETTRSDDGTVRLRHADTTEGTGFERGKL